MIVWLIIVGYLLLAAVLFFVLLRSPRGYEDAEGFHVGEGKRREDDDRESSGEN